MTRHLKHPELRTRSEIVGAPILTQISGLRRSQLRNARGSVPDDGGSAIRPCLVATERVQPSRFHRIWQCSQLSNWRKIRGTSRDHNSQC